MEILPVLFQFDHQLFNAAVAAGFGLQDFRPPPTFFVGIHLEHHRKIVQGTVGTVPVGLVDHKDIANFKYTSFYRLDIVTETGNHHHHCRMCHADNVNLVLPYPDRLDYDDIHAHGVHNIHHIGSGAGDSPQMAAGSQTPDENSVVVRMAVHPDAVPQYGAAGKGAGRVHGDNT